MSSECWRAYHQRGKGDTISTPSSLENVTASSNFRIPLKCKGHHPAPDWKVPGTLGLGDGYRRQRCKYSGGFSPGPCLQQEPKHVVSMVNSVCLQNNKGSTRLLYIHFRNRLDWHHHLWLYLPSQRIPCSLYLFRKASQFIPSYKIAHVHTDLRPPHPIFWNQLKYCRPTCWYFLRSALIGTGTW